MNKRSISLFGTVLACLAVAACGSSSSSSSSTSAAASGSTTRTKLAACLKAHGVTLPHRAGPGGGVPPGGPGGGPPGGFGGGPPGGGAGRFGSNPKFQAAFRACGANFPRRRVSPTLRRAAIQNFVTCVRRHGYKLPAPNFSGHGAIFPAKVATNSKFRAASRSCLTILRAPGRGGTPPSA